MKTSTYARKFGLTASQVESTSCIVFLDKKGRKGFRSVRFLTKDNGVINSVRVYRPDGSIRHFVVEFDPLGFFKASFIAETGWRFIPSSPRLERGEFPVEGMMPEPESKSWLRSEKCVLLQTASLTLLDAHDFSNS